mmetsp:Transcript_2249/g.5953  ORF Transcript_2249/g.5953 Transcript_2249/m.5953 type:complete len:119 (+) Transcript_2249:698-1054(+)
MAHGYRYDLQRLFAMLLAGHGAGVPYGRALSSFGGERLHRMVSMGAAAVRGRPFISDDQAESPRGAACDDLVLVSPSAPHLLAMEMICRADGVEWAGGSGAEEGGEEELAADPEPDRA